MHSKSSTIAEKKDISFGKNGFYSLRLIRIQPNKLMIEIDLSFYFSFIANQYNSNIKWTAKEKKKFTLEWKNQIGKAWDLKNYIQYRGNTISLKFICDMQSDASNSQWQARVMKLKDRSSFRTSAVSRGGYSGGYDAKLDSNDDLRKTIGDGTQTAIIHEFGHMIGAPDEYRPSSPHYSDKNSIMHSGSTVRGRHVQHILDWAKPHIDALKMLRERERSMKIQLSLVAAESGSAEIAAAELWRDNLDPNDGVHFSVRRRDTLAPVRIDEALPVDFEEFEIVFYDPANGEISETVWQPQTREAFEIFFIE